MSEITKTIRFVPFHKSADTFKKHADAGIRHAISEGRMTEQDADLIDEFVSEVVNTSNLGEKRIYKITNGLSNSIRYFKTPLSNMKMSDVNKGFNGLRTAKGLRRVRDGFYEDGSVKTKLVETGKDLSDNTKSDYMLFMKRFIIWLIDEGYCDLPKGKIEAIKPVKPKKVTKSANDLLTKQQIQDMINACTNSRDRALIATLYEGAFRVGEIGLMTWKDLDFSDPNFITANTDFKTGIPRYIPLHTARPYLIRWKNDYLVEPEGDMPVFLSQFYTNLTYRAIKSQLDIIAKKAGIKKHITPHIFRHSRITHMIRDGWSDSIVKSVAWGNLETGMFKTYVHLTNNDIISEARRRHGIEESENEDDDTLKPRQCGRCLALNTPTDNFCSVCGNPLTEEVAADLESMKNEIHSDERFLKIIHELETKIENLKAAIL